MNEQKDYMEMLTKINDNLTLLKDSMRDEIHAVNVGMVEIRAEIKHINDKLEPRIERLEAAQSLHDHNIMLMKESIHTHDISMSKVENVPEDIGKIKHRLGENEQHIVILQEVNNLEEQEKFGKRLKSLESEMLLVKERTKNVEENTKAIESQKAVWKFFQAKPIFTLVVFVLGTLAAAYGLAGVKI